MAPLASPGAPAEQGRRGPGSVAREPSQFRKGEPAGGRSWRPRRQGRAAQDFSTLARANRKNRLVDGRPSDQAQAIAAAALWCSDARPGAPARTVCVRLAGAPTMRGGRDATPSSVWLHFGIAKNPELATPPTWSRAAPRPVASIARAIASCRDARTHSTADGNLQRAQVVMRTQKSRRRFSAGTQQHVARRRRRAGQSSDRDRARRPAAPRFLPSGLRGPAGRAPQYKTAEFALGHFGFVPTPFRFGPSAPRQWVRSSPGAGAWARRDGLRDPLGAAASPWHT